MGMGIIYWEWEGMEVTASVLPRVL